MSKFRATVLSIEAAARNHGLTRPSMSSLRNAIAHVLTGRAYSAAMAAEGAGVLPGWTAVTEASLHDAATRYELTSDEIAALGSAFAATAASTVSAHAREIHLHQVDALLNHPAPLYTRDQHPAYIDLAFDGLVETKSWSGISRGQPAPTSAAPALRFEVDRSVCGRSLHAYLLGAGSTLLARIQAGRCHGQDSRRMASMSTLTEDAESAAADFQEGLAALPKRCVVDAEKWLASAAQFDEAWPPTSTLAQAEIALQKAAATQGVVLDGRLRLALTCAAFGAFQFAPKTLSRVHVETLVAMNLVSYDELDSWNCRPIDGVRGPTPA